MRNPVYANEISKTIIRLNKEFPGMSIGEHISNALLGADLYNVADKELAKMLNVYIDDITLDDFYRHSETEEYNE